MTFPPQCAADDSIKKKIKKSEDVFFYPKMSVGSPANRRTCGGLQARSVLRSTATCLLMGLLPFYYYFL